MARVPWSLLLLAVAVRAMVCLRTEVPGRDGVTYLWMAERAAEGEPAALFATVFHPLYPALVAAVLALAPGLDPVAAGQMVAAGLGALALLPLWAVALALFGERAAAWAAFAYAIGAWFARHPAECMSEGPFYLAVALWALGLCGPRCRPATAGGAAAAAWLLRPEGALLALVGAWLLWRQGRRRELAVFAAALLPALSLPLGHALWGQGFTLTPKAAFNYEVGVGGAAAPVAHYLREAAKLPGAAAEELGWLWLPLAVCGAVLHRPRHAADPRLALVLPFVLQCLLVPLLRTHWRFLSGFGILLLPLSGAVLAGWLPVLARRARWLPWLAVALLVAAEARVFGARHGERAVERELGRWIGARLGAGEYVVSDMPRLCYFAGQRPPPPRPILPAEIVAAAGSPSCRYVALVEGRTAVDPDRLRDMGLEPTEPPGLLSEAVGRRGIRLFVRTRPR